MRKLESLPADLPYSYSARILADVIRIGYLSDDKSRELFITDESRHPELINAVMQKINEVPGSTAAMSERDSQSLERDSRSQVIDVLVKSMLKLSSKSEVIATAPADYLVMYLRDLRDKTIELRNKALEKMTQSHSGPTATTAWHQGGATTHGIPPLAATLFNASRNALGQHQQWSLTDASSLSADAGVDLLGMAELRTMR